MCSSHKPQATAVPNRYPATQQTEKTTTHQTMASPSTGEELAALIEAKGQEIRELKTAGTAKDALKPHIDELLLLKGKFKSTTGAAYVAPGQEPKKSKAATPPPPPGDGAAAAAVDPNKKSKKQLQREKKEAEKAIAKAKAKEERERKQAEMKASGGGGGGGAAQER